MKKLILSLLLFALVFLSMGAYQDFQAAKSADIEYGYIPIYVTMHGARADDGLDDTAGIRKAIAFRNKVDGKYVFFPEGVYIVSDTLIFKDMWITQNTSFDIRSADLEINGEFNIGGIEK